jgi:hypothetical protein
MKEVIRRTRNMNIILTINNRCKLGILFIKYPSLSVNNVVISPLFHGRTGAYFTPENLLMLFLILFGKVRQGLVVNIFGSKTEFFIENLIRS